MLADPRQKATKGNQRRPKATKIPLDRLPTSTKLHQNRPNSTKLHRKYFSSAPSAIRVHPSPLPACIPSDTPRW